MENYIKPAMEIVEIELEQSILDYSSFTIPGLPGTVPSDYDNSDK